MPDGKIRVSAIVAAAENRVIGKDNAMPWHIPGDLKHFKKTTMGHPLVMGRRSYESLGTPLPGRANIVVSRSVQAPAAFAPTPLFHEMESAAPDLKAAVAPEVLFCSSIEEGVTRAKEIAARDGRDEIFIAGGGEIYKAALNLTERVYLTQIHRAYEGDTFFPELDGDEWAETSSAFFPGDPSYTIKVLDRR